MKKALLFVFSIFTILFMTSCMGANRQSYETYLYGRYPQTKVSKDTIIEKLDAMLDKDKNEDGYFELEGKEYAKIWAYPKLNNTYLFRDEIYIREGRYYYYQVETITWRVMKTEGNYKYLISDYILDSANYVYDQEVEDYSYDSSNIRAFVEGDFYNKAFSKETNKPLLTEVDIEKSKSVITKLNTRIWIPSVYDVENKEYGFYSIDDSYAFSTDYSASKGLDVYHESPNAYFYRCAPYATSTTSYLDSDVMYYIDCYGKNALSRDKNVLINIGVRPCIRVEVKD